MIVELNPAPREAIDVLERIERLEEENREIRRDLKEAKIFSLLSRVDDLWDWVEEIDSNLNGSDYGKIYGVRCQKIISYINNRPDHKASLETLKGVLKIKDSAMSKTIKALNKLCPNKYAIRQAGVGDKRKRELVQIKR